MKLFGASNLLIVSSVLFRSKTTYGGQTVSLNVSIRFAFIPNRVTQRFNTVCENKLYRAKSDTYRHHNRITYWIEKCAYTYILFKNWPYTYIFIFMLYFFDITTTDLKKIILYSFKVLLCRYIRVYLDEAIKSRSNNAKPTVRE